MDNFQDIAGYLLDDLNTRNKARDEALLASRKLIRCCADAIRAIHRREKASALALLEQARQAADEFKQDLAPFPDLYYAGYTQDAMKEYVEACLTYAVVYQDRWPEPRELGVETAAYLQGMAEAAAELRRYVLDIIRRGELSEAERVLEVMEEMYSFLITVDFPDALTGGLRRLTDMLRGVLERTRGDLTMAVRQEVLQRALHDFEERLNARERG